MYVNVGLRIHGGVFAASDKAMREIFDHRERRGNKDESDGGREEHAANDHGSEDATRSGARARCYPKRKAAEDEGQRRHHDGAEAQAGSAQSGLRDAHSTFVVRFSKLDDEDGVLRRQTDQHDQSDGGENVVFEQPSAQREISTEDRDRSTEQNAERQRPTLIQRGQDEEDEEQRQTKNGPGRHAFLGLLLLIGHAGIVEARTRRHGLLEDLFQRRANLAGTVTRRAGDVELRGVVFIEAVR